MPTTDARACTRTRVRARRRRPRTSNEDRGSEPIASLGAMERGRFRTRSPWPTVMTFELPNALRWVALMDLRDRCNQLRGQVHVPGRPPLLVDVVVDPPDLLRRQTHRVGHFADLDVMILSVKNEIHLAVR